MGGGRTVFSFLLLWREGKIASLSQHKFYKQCRVCQKPPRTIKRRTKNTKKLSVATKLLTPQRPSHAWGIQALKKTCRGHVPNNDFNLFNRFCSFIAQHHFQNSLSVHTTNEHNSWISVAIQSLSADTGCFLPQYRSIALRIRSSLSKSKRMQDMQAGLSSHSALPVLKRRW